MSRSLIRIILRPSWRRLMMSVWGTEPLLRRIVRICLVVARLIFIQRTGVRDDPPLGFWVGPHEEVLVPLVRRDKRRYLESQLVLVQGLGSWWYQYFLLLLDWLFFPRYLVLGIPHVLLSSSLVVDPLVAVWAEVLLAAVTMDHWQAFFAFLTEIDSFVVLFLQGRLFLRRGGIDGLNVASIQAFSVLQLVALVTVVRVRVTRCAEHYWRVLA